MSNFPTQTEMDKAAFKEFANDLEGMTIEDIEVELLDIENKLDELIPWQEALCARQRQLEAEPQP